MSMSPALARALELHTLRGSLPQFPTAEQSALFRAANKARASLCNDSWPIKIAAFRSLFKLSEHDNSLPANLSADRSMLHRGMLLEEVEELCLAVDAYDLTETVDGLLDTIYVAIGWLCELGFSPPQIERLMAEVHASNMTKVDEEGKPRYDTNGKVLKGDNYVPADIHQMVTEMSVGLDAVPSFSGEQLEGQV